MTLTTTMFPQFAGMSTKVSDLHKYTQKTASYDTLFPYFLHTHAYRPTSKPRSFICYRLKSDSFVKRWTSAAGKTPRKTIEKARDEIAKFNIKLFGVILNKVNMRRLSYAYSSYHYKYGEYHSEEEGRA